MVGCGGAGKAAAVGLQMAGAEVTLVNRGEERGHKASMELRLPFLRLSELDPGRFKILIQATGLGSRDDDPLPFEPVALDAGAVVVDMVYGARPTRLVRESRSRGILAIDGRDVLLHQALDQFRLMTGCALEESLAREVLDLNQQRSQ